MHQKYAWSAMLTQEIPPPLIVKHPIIYVSGLFQGSRLNWAALII